jgi:hypothetical protein
MSEAKFNIDQNDEEDFAAEFSDEALEAAAAEWRGAIFTLAACTGLSACPA